MARTDALVLGAGIVGTSIALHLAKRGLAVALVDRRGPGEETSYGNAGVIEGARCCRIRFRAACRRCCGSGSARHRGRLS
jgi:D-amino-acid dehydrogenase